MTGLENGLKEGKIYLDDQRSSFSLNRTKFSLDHKLSPGLVIKRKFGSIKRK